MLAITDNKKDIIQKLFRGLLFSLIPFVACVVYASLQRTAIWEINPYGVQLPQWCDEVYWYLQIEDIVEFGNPMGFMGYNESFATVGHLGAWSVFAMQPYVLLGKIFGIAPINMVYYNITFVLIAFAIFYCLVKPSYKEILKIALIYMAFPIFSRYILSGMTEPLYFAGVIIIAGFAIYFQRGRYSTLSILICYILIIYLSLSRPYMLAFILIPVYFQLKKNWKICFLTVALALGVFGIVYLFYVQPRFANYYMTVIDYSIFSVLMTEGILNFLKNAITVFVTDSLSLINYFESNTIEVIVPYQMLGALLICIVVTAVNRIVKKRSAKDETFIVNALAILIAFSIVAAMILLYVEYTSARHLIIVALFLVFFVAIYLKKKYLYAVGVALFIFIGWSPVNDLDMVYRLSTEQDVFDTTPVEEDAIALKNAFEVNWNADPWENTIAYEYCVDNMNYCYYVPKGAGVNICMPEYISENYDTIKCKYLLTPVDNTRKEMYDKVGWKILLEGKEFVLYNRIE